MTLCHIFKIVYRQAHFYFHQKWLKWNQILNMLRSWRGILDTPSLGRKWIYDSISFSCLAWFMSDCLLDKTTVVENSKCTFHHNFITSIFFLACCAIVLCHIFCYFLSLVCCHWLSTYQICLTILRICLSYKMVPILYCLKYEDISHYYCFYD